MNDSYEYNSKPLFHHKERLVSALRILKAHKQDIHNFYNSLLTLQVRSNNINILLKEAFEASVSERRGASLNRGKDAILKFDLILNNLVKNINTIIKENPQKAHQILFEELVMLENIDQKIAAMFIKFLVVYKKVWSSLLPFLYVPIDRVVIKIMKDKLKVYNGPWEQSPSVKNPQGKLYIKNGSKTAQYRRFEEFQKELADIACKIAVDRILIDELWFVGYCFCKQYPLCVQCWIKEICQASPFE